MAISPFEINVGLTRTQDYSIVKHNEDNKGFVDQQNMQVHAEKETVEKFTQVQKGDNADGKKGNFDAKGKGNGNYQGDGGKKRKKNDADWDGKIVIKNQKSIDIKI